jgi:VanZ family protein
VDKYLSPAAIERINWNVRKTAHVSEYAVLAILAYRAVAFGNPRFRSRNVILPLLIGVLYAASDEYHQSFIPSRFACAQDVFYDTAGVFAGMILCLWQHCLKRPDTVTEFGNGIKNKVA